MKIQKNITLYAQGEQSSSISEKEKGNRKTFFAGEMNQDNLKSRIQQKQEEARKKALKVVTDIWNGDRAIDSDLEARRENAKNLALENKEGKERVAELEKELEELMASRDTEGDSEEFQARKKGLEDSIDSYRGAVVENESQIMQENAIVRGTSLERLKSDPMVDASLQADAIMDAASDQIIGMIVEEAKEHIDEEQEKREEQAEKIKEEKEEKEELIQEQKEKREEQEEILEDMPTQDIVSMDQKQDQIKKELQDIVDSMKLVQEDIKGTMVDKQL